MGQHRRQLGRMHPQTQSLFFGLPREFRDIVYGLLFENRILKVGEPVLWSGEYGAIPQPAKLPSGILVSCKQAYCESIRTYKSIATFHFNDLSHAFRWIGKTIPKSYTPLITKTVIWISEDDMDWSVAGKSESKINKYYNSET